MRKFKHLLCFLCIFSVLSTQAQLGEKYVGLASYYADKFHGRMTSSGEIYHREEYTAAHRSLPFNTILEVTNKANNKTVVVKVNDRGPFVYSRVIDLSYAAARDLALFAEGEAEVEMKVLAMDNPAYSLIKGEFDKEFRQYQPIKFEIKDGRMILDTTGGLPAPAPKLVASTEKTKPAIIEIPDIKLNEKSPSDTAHRHQYVRVVKDANGNYKVMTLDAPIAAPDTSALATNTTDKAPNDSPLALVVDLTMKKNEVAKKETLMASQKELPSNNKPKEPSKDNSGVPQHTYLQVVKDADGRIRVVDTTQQK